LGVKSVKMSPTDVLDLAQESLFVLLKLCTPLMLAALIMGLLISFLQALTQIQEMTLSFIPKMFATFAAMLFLFPFFGRTLGSFTHELFDRIVGLGVS
jgi:flagellar biosynthetic protein FliQ